MGYPEGHDNETGASADWFWLRAQGFCASFGITGERVLTDSGTCCRSRELDEQLFVHTRTRPHHPQTNGKVERYNLTLRGESAFAKTYRSERAKTRALDSWLHLYNRHRHHTAIGSPPVQPLWVKHLGLEHLTVPEFKHEKCPEPALY